MKKAEIRHFVLLAILTAVLLQIAGSVSSQPSPSPSPSTSITSGAVIVGDAGYFEAENFFHVNISRYVAASGEFVLSNISNKFAANIPVTVSVLGVDLLSLQEGSSAIFNVTASNFTVNDSLLPNGSADGRMIEINATWQLVNGTSWADLELSNFNNGSVISKGATIQDFLSGETRQFRIRVKSQAFTGKTEYSILINASVSGQQAVLDFDPIIESGLVAYWDMSGVGNVSTDIYGSYDAAIGADTFRSSNNSVAGEFINKSASPGATAIWTKSDNGVWDAIGNGNAAFTLSFWYVTTDQGSQLPSNRIVGQLYGGGGSMDSQSPFLIDTGNYTGGSWFWRGYTYRNVINMSVYANGKWHNVILTENSTGGFAYIDGVPVGNKPLFTANATYSSGRNLTFGCNSDTAANTTQCSAGYDLLNAGLDEIAFWNRSFDDSDARNIYYNGTNGSFCTGDPCSWSLQIPSSIPFPEYPRSNYNSNLTHLNVSNVSSGHTVQVYFNGTFNQSGVGNRTTNLNLEAVFDINYSSTSALGASANSSIFNVTIDVVPPRTNFSTGTFSDNTITEDDHVFVNVSVTDGTEASALLDFNRSLVGWWRFEESSGTGANDTSSYSNRGTLNGFGCVTMDCAATSARVSTGKRGKALNFDGVNDYVNLSNPASLNLPAKITVEAWINTPGHLVSEAGVIVFEGNAETTSQQWRMDVDSGGILRIGHTNSGSYNQYKTASGTIKNNTWYHIAAMRNSSTNPYGYRMYINGVETNFTQTAGTNPEVPSTISGWGIGTAGSFVADSLFKGTIDEAKIWNRVLSPEEINASYAAGTYRLSKNFTELQAGNHSFRAIAVDKGGNINYTETRNVTTGAKATEAQGDTAIETGIDSSVPTATKYSEQQVYVRNLSNNQTLGRFDWVAAYGSQRWLINYITAGESYVRAPNLTTAVYVLEITDKNSAQITDEVSRLINATKN